MSEVEHHVPEWKSNGAPRPLFCFICGAPVSSPAGVFCRSDEEPNYGVCDAHLERGPVVAWDYHGNPVLLHFRDEQEIIAAQPSPPHVSISEDPPPAHVETYDDKFLWNRAVCDACGWKSTHSYAAPAEGVNGEAAREAREHVCSG